MDNDDLGTYIGDLTVKKPVRKRNKSHWQVPPGSLQPTVTPLNNQNLQVSDPSIVRPTPQQGMTQHEINQKKLNRVPSLPIDEQVKIQKEEHPDESVVIVKSGEYVVEAKPVSEISKELMRLKAVWPFDFFPNEIIIEEKRLVINIRHFWGSNTLNTMDMKELIVFEVTQSPLFASIFVKGGPMGVVDFSLNWFKVDEARKAKSLIDGLVMKEKGVIQVPSSDTNKQVEILEQVGETVVTS